MKHCIVGDIHGEYEALLNLIEKTPYESNFIFVGDLVDRGTQSAHVVRFVRERGYSVVQGNHEEMMIEYGTQFINSVESDRRVEKSNLWLDNGGLETLLSYGLIHMLDEYDFVTHPYIKEFIFQFKEDIEWMKNLPLYLELDEIPHSSKNSVIVSHSSIEPVWHLRNSEKDNFFRETVLWNRNKPEGKIDIFNVFGHTPQKYTANIDDYHACIDTGCYMKQKKGYGLLSAYCVETGELFSSSHI
jgi:serine/threonine protein phosphatase 1